MLLSLNFQLSDVPVFCSQDIVTRSHLKIEETELVTAKTPFMVYPHIYNGCHRKTVLLGVIDLRVVSMIQLVAIQRMEQHAQVIVTAGASP